MKKLFFNFFSCLNSKFIDAEKNKLQDEPNLIVSDTYSELQKKANIDFSIDQNPSLYNIEFKFDNKPNVESLVALDDQNNDSDDMQSVDSFKSQKLTSSDLEQFPCCILRTFNYLAEKEVIYRCTKLHILKTFQSPFPHFYQLLTNIYQNPDFHQLFRKQELILIFNVLEMLLLNNSNIIYNKITILEDTFLLDHLETIFNKNDHNILNFRLIKEIRKYQENLSNKLESFISSLHKLIEKRISSQHKFEVYMMFSQWCMEVLDYIHNQKLQELAAITDVINLYLHDMLSDTQYFDCKGLSCFF